MDLNNVIVATLVAPPGGLFVSSSVNFVCITCLDADNATTSKFHWFLFNSIDWFIISFFEIVFSQSNIFSYFTSLFK